MGTLKDFGFSNPLSTLHSNRQARFKPKMSEEKGFIEATSGDVVKFENEGDLVKGTFICIEESTQYPDSWAIKFKDDGKLKVVFVTKVANDLITDNRVTEGTEFILEYKGKKETKDGKYKYNHYALQYKPLPDKE